MTPYLIVTLVGVGILVLGIIADGILDHVFAAFDATEGALSPIALGVGLSLGGLAGYLCESYNAPGVAPLVATIALGVLTWGGAAKGVSVIRKKALTGPDDSLNLTGRTGRAVTALISTGEIQLDGEVTRRLARPLDDPIDKGAIVLVVDCSTPILVVRSLGELSNS